MSQFALPADMGPAIARVVRASGARRVETGGFVLADVGSTSGSVLALAGDTGFDRSLGIFHLSGEALAALFEWADEHELTVLAQWHSHPRQAFLSKTDLEHGFDVPGFRTAVVPWFQNPPSHPTDWGWWAYDGSRWVPFRGPSSAAPGFTVVTFEEGMVHEH